MKRLLWIALCTCMTLAALAQKQQGIVRTIERPGQKSVGINGVTIKINEYPNAIVSGKGGKFSFTIQGKRQGDRCLVTRVEKKGYTLIDKMPSFAYSISTPVEIVMVSNKQLQQDEKRIRDKAIEKAEANYNKRIAELERQLQEKTISEEKYREQLQHVFDGYENYIKMIDDMARRYAMTDYKGISNINRQVQECIENAELERADSLINSKGDIQQRKQELDEKRGVKQKIDSLSLALQEEIDFGTNELASDYFTKHLICAARYDNDSAAYWLEQRAALDTTNVEWQRDAGLFIEEYLAKYDLAMEYYQNGLNQSLMQYGNQSEWVARFFNDMGSVYIDRGNSVKALDCYLKAKGIRENIFGTEHQSTASIYHNIGYVYAYQGNDSLALEYQKQALYIQKQTLGEVNHSVATSYNSIGTIYMRNGDYTNALHYLLNALAIYELGKEHQDVAATNSNIAYAYCYIGNHHNALEHAQRALQIQEDIFGKPHPSIASTYNCLGFIYDKQRDYPNALECYQKALKIRELFFDTNHPDIATSYNNIGGIYYRQKNFDLALEYFQKAITINEQHPELLTASMAMPYNNVGNIYYQKGYYDTAMVYYQKALEIREHVLAKDSPDIAESYISIGNVYHKIGNGIKALDFHQKALVIRINSFGLMHRDVAQSHYNIAVIYYYQGNFTKALENFEQALDIRERILGIDDPSTQKAREKVELTRQKLQNQ